MSSPNLIGQASRPFPPGQYWLPDVVLHRTPDWLIQPEEDNELEGYYQGVIFPCGKVVIDGTLFVYYGGADKYVGLATCDLDELLAYLLTCPA